MAILAGLGILALALWSAQSSAQSPTPPPFWLYGSGNPGDVITIYDADNEELGAATVDGDGEWYVGVACAGEKVATLSFRINGMAATPEINRTGDSQAEVTLTLSAAPVSEDEASEMTDDDQLVEDMPAESEDGMSEDEMSEDGMSEEGMSEDEMGEDELAGAGDEGDESAMSAMSEGTGYPDSGTGGLADTGSSGTTLTALLVALATASVMALGLTIRRRRGLS